jgi:hypothetical protein
MHGPGQCWLLGRPGEKEAGLTQENSVCFLITRKFSKRLELIRSKDVLPEFEIFK